MYYNITKERACKLNRLSLYDMIVGALLHAASSLNNYCSPYKTNPKNININGTKATSGIVKDDV
jgi:hypothetical protein